MMLKWFLSAFCLMMITNTHASVSDDSYQMRVAWVKSLKELMLELDKTEPEKYSKNDKNFLQLFSLINEAWADSRYNCFYAGWPSVLVSSGGRKLCTSPARGNSSYENGICKESELQCQPLLFGKKLCVPARSKQEKNQAFANCEKKFQKEYNGNYAFLEKPTRKEIEDLRELSAVAKEICTQRPTGICTKVLSKFPDAMKALDQAHHEVTNANRTESEKIKPISRVSSTHITKREDFHPKDCEDPEHAHDQLSKAVVQIVASSNDELYEKMKKDFQKSDFCDPQKVLNDPADRPGAAVMVALERDLNYLGDRKNGKDARENFFNIISKKYGLPPELKSSVMPLLNSLPTSGNEDLRRENLARAKGIIIQNFLKVYKPSPELSEIALDELVGQKIFSEKDNGEIECPFVTKDAFMKALEGRNSVISKHGSKIKNKDQITIVDYSRPSNERRMFVIDLNSEKVLHNTWVAHGSGSDNQAAGTDGLGSSPRMSNTNGSLMSSDGFILAGPAAVGSLYGPNVQLQGIDKNNNNIASRAIVLHGWNSPMSGYSTGVSDYNSDKGGFDPPIDAIDSISKTDFSKASTKEMEKSLYRITQSISNGKYLPGTEGCLGVPVVNMKHLDHKNRNKTQLELLREDLPGSIIFNYSGPDMISNYFK